MGDQRLQKLYLDYMFDLIADPDGKHLHFGLFRGESADDPGLARAQDHYAKHVVKNVQPSARVLDVGCGRGGISRLLVARGCRVTAISPNPEHVAALGDIADDHDVRCVSFEKLSDAGPFDVVLFAESFAFFANGPDAALQAERTLDRVAELTSAGGICIIADLMSESVSRTLREHRGFTVLESEDLTENVAPTLDVLEHRIQRFGLPFYSLVRQTVALSEPAIAARLDGLLAGVENVALRALFRGELVERERLVSSRYLRYELRRRSA
jgi:MPBQ/MSBQ methyltransferase